MTRCPRCKGDGAEPSNPILAVLSLGLWPLIDKATFPDKCRRCGGAGYLSRLQRRF